MTQPQHEEQGSRPTELERVPQLVDMPVLARRLSTTERHLRRMVAEQRIPFVRLGRFIRFDPADVAEWLRGQTTTPRTSPS